MYLLAALDDTLRLNEASFIWGDNILDIYTGEFSVKHNRVKVQEAVMDIEVSAS